MPDYATLGAPTTTSGGAFPGSGSSASDDSLAGVSAALGAVPIAISATPTMSTSHGLSLDPQGRTPTPSFTTATIDQMIQNLYKLPVAQRAQVQQALLAAGYYGANPPVIVPGEINTADRNAYKTAVEDAARATQYGAGNTITKPVTVGQIIDERIANRTAQGIPVTAQQVNVTSPDDIRAAVQASAKQAYGKKADPKLVDHVIAQYQQLQEQAGRSTSSNVVQPPSVSTFADAQVASADPTAVAANKGLSIGNLFMQAFQSSAGQAPAPVSS